MKIKTHQWYMKIALEEAEAAFKIGEVPIGCVIVDEDDNILSKKHNLKEVDHDTTAHAEILAIREASKKIENWRLEGCTVYVTLEPCPMCLYALLQARVKQVVFGAYDPKGGSVSLGYTFYKDERFNHQFSIVGGVQHYECSSMISSFFKQRRKGYK
jgi:tRNA(adenine34) deaminase